ncbi:nitrogenase iron-molybdenum cofactor biosynthesis protein NifN [Telmatospirillum siberiense]|uniref:Nitrogenase iron-molybdenum cofactor biosynthesis protein NifN n=1 Tax=Telmatospirillum siberiense TaxID=382514 RepID=A0A2N3PNC4_9PROT|nr:nitrogenase iron-molybdenum cofactor biosynthesis protein NifN [Telmatospirillum siberiense]PKU21902.1 nitrogenase iron-molybdenum cofactor biosynthesis protein NifN [Telmatospirillum siberiense]
MAEVVASRKSLTINPLKMSQPLGGAMAFMGVDSCMPLLHGSQGCTAFGMVLLVRHFREAIPFQTTAMNEVTTILGGLDNLEQACVNIHKRTQCRVIGICTTGLTETRGEDLAGDIRLIRQRHPELDGVALVAVPTPDFSGALQTGWAKAVTAMVEQLVQPASGSVAGQVNILAGSHLTPGDIEEIREMVEAFGLEPIILPDLSGSLDGHVPDHYVGTTYGGTTVEDIRAMGASVHTIAIGRQMGPAAEALAAKAGVPFTVLDRLTGLVAVDAFVRLLQKISGRGAPPKVRRQRSQLQDAMLDGHFSFGRTKVALAAEPDLLFSLSAFLAEMGGEVVTAVTSVESPVLDLVPAARVVVGDMDDFERSAAEQGAALLMTHSHGRMVAHRLGVPLFRVGFPMFDRLGAAHQRTVGYKGTRDLIFALGNLLIEHSHEDGPDEWPPLGTGVPVEDGHAPAATH